MASEESKARSLLLTELLEPCLLAVLQCCAADNQRSLFSAARAHSRLHKAVAALGSIKAVCSEQQQLDGMLLYLGKHGSHVDGVDIRDTRADTYTDIYDTVASLRQLPSNLQLGSLQLSGLSIQLQPGGGFRGVLGAAADVAALKQLCLKDFKLLDSRAAEALAAALPLLHAGLEHLSISNSSLLSGSDMDTWGVPMDAVQRLQQLTYLELADVKLQGDASPALQALTRLVDLRLAQVDAAGATLGGRNTLSVTADMLSGTHHLTRLELFACSMEPAALAGKTQLQHLQIGSCTGGAAGVAQLLSHLQPLQQLTHLDLVSCLRAVGEGTPPAAAYSALTASSKLQHLDITDCILPAGVWQHVFRDGRQLLHLQTLAISYISTAGQPTEWLAPAPEGSRLVSCCPGLQVLEMECLRCSAELFASLHHLSRLHTLHLADEGYDDTLDGASCGGVQAVEVCKLTGLRELSVDVGSNTTPLDVYPLAELQQLTRLKYIGPGVDEGDRIRECWESGAPGDTPVWCQLLEFLEGFRIDPDGVW